LSASYLLEVSRETVKVLIIRQNSLSLSTKEVIVPNANQSQKHRQVLLQRSTHEMLVHVMSTLQELGKVFIADVDGDGETNGGPEGVATAYPVPEFEHVFGADAECGDGFGVGGESDEVLGDMGGLKGYKSWMIKCLIVLFMCEASQD
jgi:hypothetical protein